MLAENDTELRNFERTFNWSRVLGAALALVLGPFFPNVGLEFVLVLGAALLVEAVIVDRILRVNWQRARYERVARAIFGFDMGVISLAFLVFSTDLMWTTFIVGVLVVIAGGFRFGPTGALVSAGTMSAAYVAVALYRGDAFGYPVEPQRMAFHVAVYLLAAFLMSGVLRELAALRAQREQFFRQSAETEALRAIDRMKSDFLAAMSHDFRSPLTVVRGAVELLLGERPGALTSAQRELAQSAERNIRRLEEFTEELLEMARLEHGAVALDREEVDPTALVRDVVADHSVLAKDKRQWFSLDLGTEGQRIVADRDRLRQIVANLVGNAIKYAPTSTPIDVRAARTDGVYMLRVSDHGHGVPDEDRDQVFDKFYRSRRAEAFAGAGLGLAIARSLTELHGGTLKYEDTPGGGATFVMTVPANAD